MSPSQLPRRPGFGSWRGQIFDFSDFDSFEVLGHSGVYRHTFRLKFYRLHGLVGERWAINREVSGSFLSPKSAVKRAKRRMPQAQLAAG